MSLEQWFNICVVACSTGRCLGDRNVGVWACLHSIYLLDRFERSGLFCFILDFFANLGGNYEKYVERSKEDLSGVWKTVWGAKL